MINKIKKILREDIFSNDKIYYHGGDLEITVFTYDVDKKNRTNNVAGFYFTDRKEKAQSYGSKLTQAHLLIKNPYILGTSIPNTDMAMQFKKELVIANPHIDKYDDWFDEKIQYLFQYNKLPFTGMDGMGEQRIYLAGGFDAIKDGDEIAVFNSKDIKVIPNLSENIKSVNNILGGLLTENKIYSNKIVGMVTKKINDDSDDTVNKIAIAGLFRNYFGDIEQIKTKQQLDSSFKSWYDNSINSMIKTNEFIDNKINANKYLSAFINNIKTLNNNAKPFSIKNIEKSLVDVVNNNRWIDLESTQQSNDIYNPKDEDIIFENEEIVILDTNTKAKCVMYGNNESWCISNPQLNYYNTYRLTYRATPYFVLQKNIRGEEHKLVIMNYGDSYAIADRSNSGERSGAVNQKKSWGEIEKNLPNLIGLEKFFKYREVTDAEKTYSDVVEDVGGFEGNDLMSYINLKINGLVINGSEIIPEDFIRDVAASGVEFGTMQLSTLTPSVIDSLIESGYFINKDYHVLRLTQKQTYRIIKLKLNNGHVLNSYDVKKLPLDNPFVIHYTSNILIDILYYQNDKHTDNIDKVIDFILNDERYIKLLYNRIFSEIFHYTKDKELLLTKIINNNKLTHLINSSIMSAFIYKSSNPEKIINYFLTTEPFSSGINNSVLSDMVEYSTNKDKLSKSILTTEKYYKLISGNIIRELILGVDDINFIVDTVLNNDVLSLKLTPPLIRTILNKTENKETVFRRLMSITHVKDLLSASEIENFKLQLTKSDLNEINCNGGVRWGKSLVKQLLRETLRETLRDNLKTDNKLTLPKIPTNKIYKNPIGNISNYYRVVNKIDFDDLSAMSKEKVNVEDIFPTQINLNINNLKSTENISRETEAVLLAVDGKYYVLDGHHRIANRILNGDSKIFARVVKINNEVELSENSRTSINFLLK